MSLWKMLQRFPARSLSTEAPVEEDVKLQRNSSLSFSLWEPGGRCRILPQGPGGRTRSPDIQQSCCRATEEGRESHDEARMAVAGQPSNTRDR